MSYDVAIIGCGRVGLPLALAFADHGLRTLGIENDPERLEAVRSRLQAPVLAGVGAAFDFHAGLVTQAPSWMQSIGLEWAYRLFQEPGRLWRRYLRYNPRFVAGFLRQWLAHRKHR